MLFEIHMLKNFPATNLNRDETGAPKTCYFGGSQRGRISSQCLKRSWRTSELFGALESRGWRSRNLPEMVAKKLREMNVDEAYIDPAKLMLTGIANKDKTVSNDLITGQIIFFSPEDVQALADTVKALTEQYEDVQKFTKLKPDDIIGPMKKAQARAITLDIALFGRMVTSDIILNVEASMQVAHAVSTHPVNLESDYFTAVDDLIHMMDEGGAGMIGDIDYDSCCYHDAPQEVESSRIHRAFRGIEIGRDHHIKGHHHKAPHKLWHGLQSVFQRLGIRTEQHADLPAPQQYQTRHHNAAEEIDPNPHPEVKLHIRFVPGSVALPEQRLQALAGTKENGHGKGCDIGNHRKCVDANITDFGNQHQVHAQGHYGRGKLTDALRQTVQDNVLPQLSVNRCLAETQDALFANKVREHDEQTDGLGYAGGNGCACRSQRNGKNQQPVPKDIQCRGNNKGYPHKPRGIVVPGKCLQTHRQP